MRVRSHPALLVAGVDLHLKKPVRLDELERAPGADDPVRSPSFLMVITTIARGADVIAIGFIAAPRRADHTDSPY